MSRKIPPHQRLGRLRDCGFRNNLHHKDNFLAMAPHETASGSRRRRLLRACGWLVVPLLIASAWSGWREYDHRAAVREARAAGFEWREVTPSAVIRKDWRAAFRKETWGGSLRELDLGKVPTLTSVRPLLRRLRPTVLFAHGCKDADLQALNGLSSLQKVSLWYCPSLQNLDGTETLSALRNLDIFPCPALQNIDGLKGLTGLQSLVLQGCGSLQDLGALKGLTGLHTLALSRCPVLQNADALKGLTRLQELHLTSCSSLQNLDALKSLASLRTLDLTNCGTLQNVDILKELPSLQSLDLTGCDTLPLPALHDLRTAREGIQIQMPTRYFEAYPLKKSP